jgi:magnesium-transporting ATPase (P-type)
MPRSGFRLCIGAAGLGSVVAADVRLLNGSIPVDQSMLTGKSSPIEADAGGNSDLTYCFH